VKQIIAMGGGGFSMEPGNPAMDRYIRDQSGKAHPKVCFLPTAGGESPEYIIRFYEAFTALECHPSHLSLFSLPTADLASFLLEKDIIYVGGGNTKSMLALWREWRLDEILRQAWEAGVVLAGLSAGAICWFEQGVTDSVPGQFGPLDCLGYLEGSCCPHYDAETERRPAYHRLLRTGAIEPGYALDDGAALHFIGESLHRVVTSRPEAQAHAVKVVAGDIREQSLENTYLLSD
jgi:peptidase E